MANVIIHAGITTTDDRLLEGFPELGATINVGEHADLVAHKHGVNGADFTYKADGVVLERGASFPAGAATLELVECEAPADLPEVEAPADETPASPPADPDGAGPDLDEDDVD